MSLSFLEAANIVSQENTLVNREFVLAASGQTEKLEMFVKALSICRGFNSIYSSLPFNTLQQYVALSDSVSNVTDKKHIFLLFPWDLVPEFDWRLGVSENDFDLEVQNHQAVKFCEKIQNFKDKRILYFKADVLPISLNSSEQKELYCQLEMLMYKAGARIISSNSFSLSSYLANGNPYSGKELSKISDVIVDEVDGEQYQAKKLLVTDFDNVLWKGVIGEDGVEGIYCQNEGVGYVHYIFQSYLLKLKKAGVLLAGVTRNDSELAELPFKKNKTLLTRNDFVEILASYEAKSSQIELLAENLNLNLDSIVFVDDNPLEIEEVKLQLPKVRTILFPPQNEMFPQMMADLQKQFVITNVTNEDKKRTELYRSRKQSSVPSNRKGADLFSYLATLNMRISPKLCSERDYERPLQLINKTNQFNLNGNRLTEQELQLLLKDGSKLFSFGLKDKFGDHGQVISLFVDQKLCITHFVMSCRVFQRKAEYACLIWLIKFLDAEDLTFDFHLTKYNTPFKNFIDEKYFSSFKDTRRENKSLLNSALFLEENEGILDLFKIELDN